MKDGGPIAELCGPSAVDRSGDPSSFDEPVVLRSRAVAWLEKPWTPADIVALNPARDVVDMTAAVAAKLLKEVAGAILH